MAGICIMAVALIVLAACVWPDGMGAMETVGRVLNEQLGTGRFAVAAFLFLIGCEAFVPHQALSVPMLVIGLSLLWACMQILGDLAGGLGGAVGRSLAQGLETAVGRPGTWIVSISLVLIDLQWITRISLRGPARVLAWPLRVSVRLLRLVGRGIVAGWAATCENWERVKAERAGRAALCPFPVSVVAEGEARRGRTRPADEAPEFPPMRQARALPEATTKSGDGRKAPAGSGSLDAAGASGSSEPASRGRRKTAAADEAVSTGPIFPDYPVVTEEEPEDDAVASVSPAASQPDVTEGGEDPIAEADDRFDPDFLDDIEIPGYEDDDVAPGFDGGDDTVLDAQAPPWDVEEAEVDNLAPEAEAFDEEAGPDKGEGGPAWTRKGSRGPAEPRVEALSLWDEEVLAEAAPPPPRRQINYRLPSIDLLEVSSPPGSQENLADFSRVIVETLNSFGVATRIVNVEKGPTVTRYELQPARGVKVSKITSLNNDIALALAAQSIRIEAPIPGKSAIGIEVPNSRVEAVRLREIVESGQFGNGNGLMLALGKDISGRSVVADLLRAPHLLIAGATGSGKSVCLNTVIVSLLYKHTPQQLQMVMVDPKRVELSIFEGIPHLANTHANPNSRIVKDAKSGTLVLKQATEIMNQRFELLSRSRVRNIGEYNAKADVPMPYLVIIVDELAQLMQISARSVEGYLQELAQMGRAAGIHLILATQRPSVDVLTGTIKSNFPARIAFAVSAQVDSRTILDRGGAEKLLGRGDMLFSPTDAELRRVQGALITLEETERVVDFWRAQEAPDNLVPLSLEAKSPEDMLGQGGSEGEDEDLLREAVRIIRETKLASASNLQRKLQVGYPRAARLVDELEQRGFLGPANGSKPRKILFLED